MRILIVNPPHPSIGSRMPREHLPPLGLLSIGGPLIDGGHAVSLLDADRLFLPRGLRQLIAYDPDLVQTFFATPHRWTPYAQTAAGRRVIQDDLSKWDYKHQVLATRRMPPWRVFAWLKLIEIAVQLRPRSLFRLLARYDAPLRRAMRWHYRVGRRVWLHEIFGFLLRDRRLRNGPTLEAFWGALDCTESAMRMPGDAAENNCGDPARPRSRERQRLGA